jgi:hypothetical protein
MSTDILSTPWEVDENPRCGGYAVLNAERREVAVATQRDPHPTFGQGITDAEALAHAHLFAAARELLAALEVVVANWSGQFERAGHLSPSWCQQARSAIAKATGVRP